MAGSACRPALSAADRVARFRSPAGVVREASRAGYGLYEAESDLFVMERDWNAPGIASVAGRHRLADFGIAIDSSRGGNRCPWRTRPPTRACETMPSPCPACRRGNGHLDPGMAVLTKPFAMDDLARKIREFIAK